MVPRKVMCFTQCHAGMIISESFQIVLFALRFSNYTTLIHTHTHTLTLHYYVFESYANTHMHTQMPCLSVPHSYTYYSTLCLIHTHMQTHKDSLHPNFLSTRGSDPIDLEQGLSICILKCSIEHSSVKPISKTPVQDI